jgi:hypothetical protein
VILDRYGSARFGWLVAAVVLAGTGAVAAQPAPTTGETLSPSKTEEPVKVLGFRSAQWGMNAGEVKAAIKKDFNVPPEKVKPEENSSERTTVLSVVVPDLIEGAGKAHVSYILGYTSKKLIQVNITWGTPVDKEARIDQVVAAANQLRALFLTTGYQPDTITSNLPTSDGTIVVFQGQDTEKHTTLLRLANGSVPGPVKQGKREPPTPTVALQLSYIMDARNPDIFRLKKGQF